MNDEFTENEAAGNVLSAFIKAFRNYFNFKGRTCRYDYWGFLWINGLIGLLLMIAGAVNPTVAYFYTIYAWIVFVPGVSAFVRRLHDVNKSFIRCVVMPLVLALLMAWGTTFVSIDVRPFILFFVGFFSFVCGIALLVFTCRKGYPESNQYGESIIETLGQDRKAKWLIFIFCILPILSVISVLIIGGISGYDKSMRRFQQLKVEVNANQTLGATAKVNGENAQ